MSHVLVFDRSPIYTFTIFLCFVIFYLSISPLALMHFYHLLIACSIYSFRYVYHIFISYMTFMVIYYTICYSLCPCTVIIYCFHIPLSCTVIYCIHVLFHVFILHICVHTLISCYRTYHHIAVLCLSYHIISFHMSYSNHLF